MKVSMFVSISLLSLLVRSSSSSSVPASPVTCSSDGVQCGYNETSLLEAVMQVEAVAECRQLCLARADCGYISYYGEAAVPVSPLLPAAEQLRHGDPVLGLRVREAELLRDLQLGHRGGPGPEPRLAAQRPVGGGVQGGVSGDPRLLGLHLLQPGLELQTTL